MAMVEAPIGMAVKTRERAKSADQFVNSNDETPELTEITVPADTPIDVETAYSVSSEDVQEGSKIGLIVINAVKVKGVTVIERNARATAIVTKATAGRRWARGGVGRPDRALQLPFRGVSECDWSGGRTTGAPSLLAHLLTAAVSY